MLHCFKTCTIKTYMSSNWRDFLVEILEENRATIFSQHDIAQIARNENEIALYIQNIGSPTIVALASDTEAIRFYNIMKNCMEGLDV